jgi:beta-N-acetylhexosaminidase
VSQVSSDAHAVLLPLRDAVTVDGWLEEFVLAGGRSVLLASGAEEYAARRMSEDRRQSESAEQVRDFANTLRDLAGEPVFVAVDAEPIGVQRLEHLLPSIPRRDEIAAFSDEQLYESYVSYATAALDLGVNLFLGPVVDQIAGKNEWLQGRIAGDTLDEITRIALAYVRAVQSVGVTATAKHFPGHPHLDRHPVEHDVALQITRDEVERNLRPFRTLIDANVGAVMIGPVAVDALDADNPAALSPTVIQLLRRELGFQGLIISDDLDAVSTLQGRSLGDAAVASIAAGVELLLIPGDDAVMEISHALARAVEAGALSADVLAVAANKVRSLARQSERAEP